MDVDNTQAIMDSRNIIEYLEYLQENTDTFTANDLAVWRSLVELNKQGEANNSDWQYGCPVIRHTYFTEYIKGTYADIHEESLNNLPNVVKLSIDWNTVAEFEMISYTEIDFDGQTYYVLSI